MELIKKIKEAEAQAQQIIEHAKSQAAEQAESGRQAHLEQTEQAEHERRKAIDAAVAEANSQGRSEAENLKAEAENRQSELRNNTRDKVSTAAARVMDYLKG